MSTRDVEETIIRPMRRLYLPPRHLRQFNADDPDAIEETLKEYGRALEGYDRETLERAWAKVRAVHDYSIWPTPASLVQAAEASLPRPRPPSELELRRQRALAQAEDYVAHFMKRRQLAKLAKREGWANELQCYVYAVAWVQAQLIEELDKDGMSLPRELIRAGSFHSTREALAEFKEAFAGPVGRGEIDVRVPKPLIVNWKAAAHRRTYQSPAERLDRVAER